jgi:phage terminase large subunit-like protein
MNTIAPAQAIAHLTPDILDKLSDAQLTALLWDARFWMRPEQTLPPPGGWLSYTVIGGRGFGKTYGILRDIHRGVQAGDITRPALVAPNTDDARKKQIWPLVESSPPWFRAEEYDGGIRWPNGVYAPSFTAEAERPAAGHNLDYVWMTEVVDWRASRAAEVFATTETACRVGRYPRTVIDTTSKGVNALILKLLKRSEAQPNVHLMRRGTIFDNPLLSTAYVAKEIRGYVWGSRRAREELLGEAFAELAGALWEQSWLDIGRREIAPASPDQTLLAWDPALSDRQDADEQGLCKACSKTLGNRVEVFVTKDLSRRAQPVEMARLIVEECARNTAGVIIETNRGGTLLRAVLDAEARNAGLIVELLPRDAQFPRRTPGRIYVREVHTAATKDIRAHAPAALYQQGRVHHVGTFVELENEMVSWDPGAAKSPNRLDACAYVVAELAGVATPTPDGRAAVTDAAAAQSALTEMIRSKSRRGRRGLGVG